MAAGQHGSIAICLRINIHVWLQEGLITAKALVRLFVSTPALLQAWKINNYAVIPSFYFRDRIDTCSYSHTSQHFTWTPTFAGGANFEDLWFHF